MVDFHGHQNKHWLLTSALARVFHNKKILVTFLAPLIATFQTILQCTGWKVASHKVVPIKNWNDEHAQIESTGTHDADKTSWRHQIQTFQRYWPFVRGIHRWPVNSLHKGQWREALVFDLICAWINGWVNNREAGDLRRHRAHYDVIVMRITHWNSYWPLSLTAINPSLLDKMVAISRTIFSNSFL